MIVPAPLPLDQIVAEIPRDQIPAAITALASRLLIEPVENGNGQPAPVDNPILHVEEIARLLGRSRRWVWRSQKRLKFLRRVGRGLVASQADVEAWIANQRIK